MEKRQEVVGYYDQESARLEEREDRRQQDVRLRQLNISQRLTKKERTGGMQQDARKFTPHWECILIGIIQYYVHFNTEL